MDAVLQNFRRSFGPSTPFFHSLLLESLVTMEELYRRVDKYSTLEDNIRIAAQTVMITNQSTEGNKLSGKKSSEPKEGQSKDRKRSHDQSQKNRGPCNSPSSMSCMRGYFPLFATCRSLNGLH